MSSLWQSQAPEDDDGRATAAAVKLHGDDQSIYHRLYHQLPHFRHRSPQIDHHGHTIIMPLRASELLLSARTRMLLSTSWQMGIDDAIHRSRPDYVPSP